MKKLYIVGNGFDRFHNLPTTYSDFHKFVAANHQDLENIFEEYFMLTSYSDHLWKDFENDLSTFKWKAFFDDINNIDVSDENFRPSYIYGLEDDLVQESDLLIDKIREAFEDWLTDLSLEDTNRKLLLEENSFFLNFNYTLTLEEVYEIPSSNILHIHGDVENSPGSFVFGHNKNLEEQPEFDENGESNRTRFSDSEDNAKYPFYALQKPVKDTIDEYDSFFKGLNEIDEIIILGHSLNSIDLPYFRAIRKNVVKEVKWNVSFYNDEEKTKHLKTLLKIGIDTNKVEFFKMFDYNIY